MTNNQKTTDTCGFVIPAGKTGRISEPLRKALNDERLGKLSDRKLSEELGVSKSTVSKARRMSGMPAVLRPEHTPENIQKNREKMDSFDGWGDYTDKEIASQLGVSVYVVCGYRAKMGIPAFNSTRSIDRRIRQNHKLLQGWR